MAIAGGGGRGGGGDAAPPPPPLKSRKLAEGVPAPLCDEHMRRGLSLTGFSLPHLHGCLGLLLQAMRRAAPPGAARCLPCRRRACRCAGSLWQTGTAPPPTPGLSSGTRAAGCCTQSPLTGEPAGQPGRRLEGSSQPPRLTGHMQPPPALACSVLMLPTLSPTPPSLLPASPTRLPAASSAASSSPPQTAATLGG